MFSLDSRLHNDTFFVCDLSLCRVLLMNDRQFPWLILVPMKNNIAEIIDLTEKEQITLLKESALASKAMMSLFSPLKLNVAALGNVVARAQQGGRSQEGAAVGAVCVRHEQCCHALSTRNALRAKL